MTFDPDDQLSEIDQLMVELETSIESVGTSFVELKEGATANAELVRESMASLPVLDTSDGS